MVITKKISWAGEIITIKNTKELKLQDNCNYTLYLNKTLYVMA